MDSFDFDNFDPSLMGDPSSYGLDGIDWSNLGAGTNLGDMGGLNAGWDYPITMDPPSQDTIDLMGNSGGNQGSNWSGNADPMGGYSMDDLSRLFTSSGLSPAQIAQIAASRAQSGGGKPGVFTNRDGSINWASILPMILGGVSGAMGRNATNQATQQTIDGLHNASAQATSLINGPGGAAAGYQPFMQQGGVALSKLAGQAPSNLASQFGALAPNYGPLGSGKGLSQGLLPGQFRK